ncbi:DivIVA domain-containing protein [Nocardioides marmoribigeumensis]|uniref:DivIVA domain-containing protein n=1 Tax=Nocardioides marmoribigeumensis TaxID=433649 RepID=A0ABU2C1Z5_9ACTN|nr:DivIVA domain-containing protein [Nocardioides marmoribigeumensis]MDR7364661.1 DivIVA domain-containing protein [Nocardioides marmoribigeumensis]
MSDRTDPAQGGDASDRRPRRGDRAFRLARFTALGYEREAVDRFLAEVGRAMSSTPPTMAPYEIQDARFPAVRWSRGYDMRAVDERLQELRDELREIHGDDGVGEVQGHTAERRHRRLALTIYAVATVIVLALVVVAILQL